MLVDDVVRTFRAPAALLTDKLGAARSLRLMLLGAVVPLAAIRATAVLVRSLVAGNPLPGLVLGVGSFALQIGTWLGLALVLPALARQFEATIDDRRSVALVTYASIPLWVAGVLFIVPEEPTFAFVWSRLVAGIIAAWGLVVMHRGFDVAGVPATARMPLLGGVAVAAIVIYGVLFVLFGLTSHIVLFILGSFATQG